MRWWFAVLLVILAGCTEAPTEPTADIPPGPDVPESVVSKLSFAGTILYRVSSYDAPTAGHTGDANFMCISMPPGVSSVVARLNWSEADGVSVANLGIDLIGNTKFTTFDQPVAVGTGQVQLEVHDQLRGDWFLYAGHAAPGGPVSWTLDLAFTHTGGEPTVVLGSDC